MKVRKLLSYLNTCNQEDEVVIQTIDLNTEDVCDLYPFYVDEITMNESHNEIRLCQMRNDRIDSWVEQKQTIPKEKEHHNLFDELSLLGTTMLSMNYKQNKYYEDTIKRLADKYDFNLKNIKIEELTNE